MNYRAEFDRLLSTTLADGQIIATVELTTGRRLNYTVKVEGNRLILDETDPPSSDRFKGLQIDLDSGEEVRYIALQKNAVGYRFFSFEGVRHFEITLNEMRSSTAGGFALKSPKRMYRFVFDVDQSAHKLVNMRISLAFETVNESICVWWQDEHVGISSGGKELSNRVGTYADFCSRLRKIRSPRLQHFT